MKSSAWKCRFFVDPRPGLSVPGFFSENGRSRRMNTELGRTCRKCGEWKESPAFRTLKSGALDSYCRDCRRAYMREYVRKRPHKPSPYKPYKSSPCSCGIVWRFGHCRFCHKETGQSDARACVDCRRERDRWRTIRRKYHLGRDEYERMFAAQDGRCGMCDEPSDKLLRVDHDHSCCPGKFTCGKCIRGLLCDRCNSMLGQFSDDAERARSFADRMEEWTVRRWRP